MLLTGCFCVIFYSVLPVFIVVLLRQHATYTRLPVNQAPPAVNLTWRLGCATTSGLNSTTSIFTFLITRQREIISFL